MVHTYEVMVDTREYLDFANSMRSTFRYEIDAETREKADNTARNKAKFDHPNATEYDIRITRLLR